MKRFNSLLVPLDDSACATKAVYCAFWLAETLGATLHILLDSNLQGKDSRLQLPGARHVRVLWHRFHGNAADTVLRTVREHGVALVIMTARAEPDHAACGPSQYLGPIAQAVIKCSPVPVLLLPMHYHENLPWTSMLAAISGDLAADRALETATHLASALRLKVRAIHVGDDLAPMGAMPLGEYADAAHHEYPRRIEDMVERGLTGCTQEESHCVDRALLLHGNAVALLLEQARRQAGSVLALGWHGTLDRGRALVLKRLMEEAECALLLVRGTESSGAKLKIGAEIED